MACLWGVTIALGQATDFMPYGDGYTWTYDSGEVQVMTGPQELFGIPDVMALTRYIGGQPVSQDFLAFRDEAVYSIGTQVLGQEPLFYEPAFVLYLFEGSSVADNWENESRIAGVDMTVRAEVVGVSGVKTPLGKFNAIQLRQSTVFSSGAQNIVDFFLVPTIGVVKYQTPESEASTLVEFHQPDGN